MTKQLRTNLISEFTCLVDKCEDTCCKHWSMQMDVATFDKYKKEAPELMDTVEPDHDGALIMRKDPNTGYCVKFDDGACGIHASYGENFLGDACYFYPRITRNVGENVIMTATMSCPEITRIALSSKEPFAFKVSDIPRFPEGIKDILPEGLSDEDAMAVHALFIEATQDDSVSAEKIFARINSVSRSLQKVDKKDWRGASSLYLRLADSSLPAPEENINDPFNLLHSVCGLVVASKKSIPPRLQKTIGEMEQALCVTLDWKNVLIHTSDKSLDAYHCLHAIWKEEMQEVYQPILRRWLGAQLSAATYPFAGLGDGLPDKATIIGVRLAIVRLALMSSYYVNNKNLPQEETIRIIQSLSRFLDHLATPSFSLDIYQETGWDKEKRMLGLLKQ